jgi:hypothetical protein
METVHRSLFVSMCLSLLPIVASAQTLAGGVRDTSGAVLPGVTVEVASPALIERVRSAVSDGSGQYRIPDLPPGLYNVTYTLPGFTTIVREGVSLTGAGVTTLNVEMRVGALEETITVTGATPVVDVQTSTQRQQVLSGDVVRALPASRGYGNYIAAVPGIQGTGFSSGAQPTTNFFSSRGGVSTEGVIQIDGMNVGAPGNGGGVSGYMYDMANSAEVQVSVAGGLAEADRGGPRFNIIPRTGGNTFSGMGFASTAGQWAQSSNIDDRLTNLGFAELPALIKTWDMNFALGGPVLRDRVWFYSNIRSVGTHQETQNQYANANAGNPSLWTFQRDADVKVRNANAKLLGSTRLTWQASGRNKVGFYIDYTKNCTGSAYTTGGSQCRQPGDDWTASGPGIGPGVTTVSPESGTIWDDRSKIVQASWTSTVSSRVLIDTGYSAFYTRWGDVRPYGALTDFIAVQEQSTATGVPFANYIYRGWNPAPSTDQRYATWRASLAYVTGTHNLKFGYTAGHSINQNTTVVGQQISYRFNNGVPNQLSQRVGATRVNDQVRYDAFYAQDQWTRGRLTLQGGLRYEKAWSWAPEGKNGILEAHQFGGPLLFPRTEGVTGYHDITPRIGAAYDVFGTGRTAIKVSMSKYLAGAFGQQFTINNPGATLVTTVNRAWTDANNNRVAECNFMDPATNGECGAWSNLDWGSSQRTVAVNPDVLKGWGVRNYDWQFSAGVQQELLPRVSVDVAYSRRWWGNFFVTHNRALGPQDWDTVTLTAPSHPMLPGGGGYPVSFLTRNTNSLLGAVDNYYTRTSDFGDETRYWHGIDVTFIARLQNGLLFQGGTNTGRGVNDGCAVQTARFGRPERVIGADQSPDCRYSEPWLTTLRGLASYTIPKADVQVSAIVRSQPNASPGAAVATNGAARAANFQMTAAQFLAATGQALRPGLTSQTVNLLLPGQLYGDRINNVDMRFAKIVRFGRTRANIGLDLYNLFNANTPTTYEQVYNPATNGDRWMQPTAVLLPRFMRVNVQVDF